MDFVQPLLDWITAHPTWAGIVVFLIAFSESMAVIGLFVPGAVLTFGIGALVGLGTLELWSTLLWAIAGAIVGDGLSYWLGWYYRDHLRDTWLFRRYPQLIARGEAFFERHGGKSVVLGRFFGPVRAIVPAVAGMLGMPGWRFTFINVASAIIWAPVYIAPGVVFGASLGLASEVASRLVALLALLIASIWLLVWLVRRIYRYLAPRAVTIADGLLDWGSRHVLFRYATASLLDPRHPEARGLLALAVLVIVASGAFVAIFGLVVEGLPLPVDQTTWHTLRGLRTPWADGFMVAVAELGDGWVALGVAGAVGLFLIWRCRWFALLHWVAAMGFAVAAPILLKLALQLPNPVEMSAELFQVGFPSWHAALNTVLYGFLAVMLARELPPAWRWLSYALAAVLVLLLGLSRLYLGAHSVSDVVGGIFLGLAWVALLGLAYRRHAVQAVRVSALAGLVLLALAVAGAWHISERHAQDMQRYAVRHEIQQLAAEEWWRSAWARLPAMRVDLKGKPEQPLTVQWLGDITEVRQALLSQGWQVPPALEAKSLLQGLAPQPPLAALPVPPQVHDGAHEALRLVYPLETPEVQLVLRLWSARAVTERDMPLWLGYVAYQRVVRPFPLLSWRRSEPLVVQPLERFEKMLTSWQWRVAQRPGATSANDAMWRGEVMLIRQKKVGGGSEESGL